MINVKQIIRTYIVISAIIGAPLLAVTLILGLQRTAATVTCELASMHFSQSWGAKAYQEVNY